MREGMTCVSSLIPSAALGDESRLTSGPNRSLSSSVLPTPYKANKPVTSQINHSSRPDRTGTGGRVCRLTSPRPLRRAWWDHSASRSRSTGAMRSRTEPAGFVAHIEKMKTEVMKWAAGCQTRLFRDRYPQSIAAAHENCREPLAQHVLVQRAIFPRTSPMATIALKHASKSQAHSTVSHLMGGKVAPQEVRCLLECRFQQTARLSQLNCNFRRTNRHEIPWMRLSRQD